MFTYFVASLASVPVGHDESKQSQQAAGDSRRKIVLADDEAKVVRRILSRLQRD